MGLDPPGGKARSRGFDAEHVGREVKVGTTGPAVGQAGHAPEPRGAVGCYHLPEGACLIGPGGEHVTPEPVDELEGAGGVSRDETGLDLEVGAEGADVGAVAGIGA